MATGGGEEMTVASTEEVPPVCRYFNSPTGCKKPACSALHVCFYFVTNKCRYGKLCRLSHTVDTPRSGEILRRCGWRAADFPRLMVALRSRYQAGGVTAAARSPEICVYYNCSDCHAAVCPYLHFCYQFAVGLCSARQCRRTVPLSHSLASDHNVRVLRACGLENAAFADVLRLLQEQQLRPAVCRRHNTPRGCSLPNCMQFHICFYYAGDTCVYGARCRYGHDFKGPHNSKVIIFYGADPIRALAMLREDIGKDSGSRGRAAQVLGTHSSADRDFNLLSHGTDAELQQNAQTAKLVDERDKIEQNFFKMAEINSETERKLQCVEREKTALQLEAERQMLIAQEKVEQLAAQHAKLILEKDNVERSLFASAENSLEYESVVAGLNEKLVSLELCIQIQQNEQSLKLAEENRKLAEELERARREKREEEETRAEELERTLVCSICLEMFIRATTLGCSHTFCESCIQAVERNTGRCPMCRSAIHTKTRSLTLDEMVAKTLETMDRGRRAERRTLLAERQGTV